MATALVDWCLRASKRRFFRFGVPFLVMMVGGSFALKQFTAVRYEFRQSKKITNQEAEKYGIKMKHTEAQISLDEVYDEIKEKDLEHWENIRGPRPWEDSKSVQDEQRQKQTVQA